MLPSELLQECMERRDICINIMSTLTEIKVPKLQRYLDGELPTDKDMDKICKGLKIDENNVTYSELNISVKECAKLMMVGVGFVRNAVEKGKMPGISIETNGNRTPHIPRKAFMCYMEQWNTDKALQEEVKLLKVAMNEMSNVMNDMVSVISDLANAIKNAPLPEQDRAQDSIS